jgi:uncharacterized protein (DUF302 family)
MRAAGKDPGFQPYSHARTLYMPDTDTLDVRDRVEDALEHSGFSVLNEIDLGEILNRRLGVHIEPHIVIEVCHPELARRALSVASDASLLLAGQVAVWKEGTGATVGILPPLRLVQALGREHLGEVAAEAHRRLEDVLSLLAHTDPREPLPASRTPLPNVALTAADRSALIEAVRQRRQALLVEAAGTEKRELQHALAETIDQLDALLGKLDRPNLPA